MKKTATTLLAAFALLAFAAPTVAETPARTTQVYYGDIDNNSAALDLTGYTARWALARRTGSTPNFSTPAVLKLSTTNGHMTIDAVLGIIGVELKNADTAPLLGDYEYQLRIVDGAGEWSLVATGPLKITAAA